MLASGGMELLSQGDGLDHEGGGRGLKVGGGRQWHLFLSWIGHSLELGGRQEREGGGTIKGGNTVISGWAGHGITMATSTIEG